MSPMANRRLRSFETGNALDVTLKYLWRIVPHTTRALFRFYRATHLC